MRSGKTYIHVLFYITIGITSDTSSMDVSSFFWIVLTPSRQNTSLTVIFTPTLLSPFSAHLSITQVSLCHGAASVVRRPSVRPSTFHILNLFSRTAEGIYSKPATNVPYEVPSTKCCYFLSRSEIHYGRPGLWLKGIYSKLSTNVPYVVSTKCCYFLSWSEI